MQHLSACYARWGRRCDVPAHQRRRRSERIIGISRDESVEMITVTTPPISAFALQKQLGCVPAVTERYPESFHYRSEAVDLAFPW